MEWRRVRFLILSSIVVLMLAIFFIMLAMNDDYPDNAAAKKVKTVKTVRVFYFANEGEFTASKYEDKTRVIRRVGKGKKCGTAPAIEREGFVLKGWFTKKYGGIKVTKKTIISKPTQLYASWEKIN